MSRVIARRIAKLPNYVRRFGALSGLRLLVQIERNVGRNSDIIRRYNVPGFPPICLRDTVSDHAIFWQCLVQCHYDFRAFPQTARLMAAYKASVARGVQPLIVDCGANVGLASTWFARHFPEARILAVEPDPDNLHILRMNVASFGSRVTPVHGAVWFENGHVSIVNPEAGSAAFQVAASLPDSGRAVPAFSISHLCTMVDAAAPFIVKIDIEGAQASLFRANTDWVGETHLITLELDDWLLPWKGTSRSFFSCLSRYPFDYLIRGESIFCFRDFFLEGN